MQTATLQASEMKQARNYVLDTNVLLHDPRALFRFADNHVHLPMTVLEELDAHKKGDADTARNAREVSRVLNKLIEGLNSEQLEQGVALNTTEEGGQAAGRLFFIRLVPDISARIIDALGLETASADNRILAAVAFVRERHTLGTTALVSKDVNLRVKALACGLTSQDYRNDRILNDSDLLPVGYQEVRADFWEKNAIPGEEVFFREGHGPKSRKARIGLSMPLNTFVIDVDHQPPTLWRVEASEHNESRLFQVGAQKDVDTAVEADSPGKAGKRRAKSEGPAILTPRNPHQAMALNLLHDDSLDVVSLLGNAGTGKTLLALAAGISQVQAGRFTGVILTRPTVPLGEDIGFLPGTEEDKMAPWLGGTLDDCFEALGLPDQGSAHHEMRNAISVRAMSFMRSRSFHRKYIIVDEAQNLTSLQVRGLLTRAGDGSKVVLTGNTAQIDTPYLDEGSSGLVWAVKTLHGWAHGGNIILPRGERSRLATFVESAAHNQKR